MAENQFCEGTYPRILIISDLFGLGMKDAEDQIKPHVEKLDQEMNMAKKKLEVLAKSSEGAWDDLKIGVESSIDIMKVAFDSAQEHFTKEIK